MKDHWPIFPGGHVHLFLRKLSFLILFLLLNGCNTEDAPDCFQTTGEVIRKEILLEPFHEVIVHKGIQLFIQQGPEQQVIIESGANLIDEVSAEIEEGRLVLKNSNGCNMFREYNITRVFITVPDLTWLQNAGNNEITGVGELHFPEIRLLAAKDKDPDIYSIGDFRLQLVSDKIRITSDNYSNFFLSGSTQQLDVYIADGDSRVEAAELVAEKVQVRHHGTNKLIVNPQQELRGEIRSTGDVISVMRPPVVDVEVFYSGKLFF